MKGWVYILKNEETGRYYVGSTNNIERRVRQHRNSHTRTTKVLRTFILAYTEEFASISDARIRERQLKSYKSKKYLEALVNSNLNGVNKAL